MTLFEKIIRRSVWGQEEVMHVQSEMIEEGHRVSSSGKASTAEAALQEGSIYRFGYLRRLEKFPESVKTFIKQVPWTLAKTYTHTWPHEYIVEEHVDQELFEKMAHHIDAYGYKEYFYTK